LLKIAGMQCSLGRKVQTMTERLNIVVAAAGTGSRMGSTTNKQFMLLGNKPVLIYCLDFFEAQPEVESIVVVCRADEVDYCSREIIQVSQYSKVSAVIAGGPERQDSVWNGLCCLQSKQEWVAIHDGARPLLTADVFGAVFQAARQFGAAIPGLPPKDTLKTVDRENFVQETLKRSAIVAVQTPQIFKASDLLKAYDMARTDNFCGTDDASLYERYIGKVKVVEGDYQNIKITTPEDLYLAEAILQARADSAGQGGQ